MLPPTIVTSAMPEERGGHSRGSLIAEDRLDCSSLVKPAVQTVSGLFGTEVHTVEHGHWNAQLEVTVRDVLL